MTEASETNAVDADRIHFTEIRSNRFALHEELFIYVSLSVGLHAQQTVRVCRLIYTVEKK